MFFFSSLATKELDGMNCIILDSTLFSKRGNNSFRKFCSLEIGLSKNK